MKTKCAIETALKLLFILRIIRMALIFSVGWRGGEEYDVLMLKQAKNRYCVFKGLLE